MSGQKNEVLFENVDAIWAFVLNSRGPRRSAPHHPCPPGAPVQPRAVHAVPAVPVTAPALWKLTVTHAPPRGGLLGGSHRPACPES